MARQYLFFILIALLGIGAGLSTGLLTISVKTQPVLQMQTRVSRACVKGGICDRAAIQRGLLNVFPEAQTFASDQLSLLFVGDMMFDRHVADRMRQAKQLNYPFLKVQPQLSSVFPAHDALIGNLEGPVTSERRAPVKAIDFAFEPSIVSVLHDVGVDAVSQANNHSLDQGRIGADESRDFLHAVDIAVFGDEVRTNSSSALTVLERRGQKIALVGFNATEHSLDKLALAETLVYARAQADRVIVFMHWGQEYQAKPNMAQIELGHWFVDQGVDAVIGAHPHWVQSIEVYHNHPIVYSLGNFIFDQDWSTETQHGLAVNVLFSGQGGEVDLFPVHLLASQPEVLLGNAREQQLDRLADISDPILRQEIQSGVVHFSSL